MRQQNQQCQVPNKFSTSVSSDLKALYKSAIIVIIIMFHSNHESILLSLRAMTTGVDGLRTTDGLTSATVAYLVLQADQQ